MTDQTPRAAIDLFAHMLDAAGLPRFASAVHRPETQTLEISWDHGFTLYVDLTRDDFEPFDEYERAAILGLPLEPVHIYVPGCADDPRTEESVPGLVIHRGPPLHPDDLTVIDGIPITSPSRTLIDLAEIVTPDELREAFARAAALGLLDEYEMRQSRGRVEWRPSLAALDEVIAEFFG
jgi:hypothetical protein